MSNTNLIIKKIKVVQFRFLQIFTHIVADERVTIGLFHWDGTKLRKALSINRVPYYIYSKDDLTNTIKSFTACNDWNSLPHNLGRQYNELHTGFLYWSATKTAQSVDTQKHFEHLVNDLRLI